MRLPRFAHQLRRQAGIASRRYNVGRRWSRPEEQPPDPSPLSGVPLYAVIAPWFEADVIAASVANAFAQGCERVFIVDNDSPDETVAEARAAGAEIASVYATEYYDEARRIAEIRRVVETVSDDSRADHIWWLLFDADEFPHGPGGRSVGEHLAGLDRRFRAVGARVFNHYPSADPANVPGRHPLDYQPLCQEVRVAWCSRYHYKHPLVRWDRAGPPLWPGNGMHRTAPSPHRVVEPTTAVFVHHFQYRQPETTYARLRRLCEPPEGAGGPADTARTALEAERGDPAGQSHRFTALDHVYAGDWDQVPLSSVNRPIIGVQLRPWAELVGPDDAVVARWYEP